MMYYLDHNSTTFLNPHAKEVMESLGMRPLNPSSVHSLGRDAKYILEEARRSILSSFGAAENYNLAFTSSGTEANNLVLKNFDEVLISAIEHLSIYEHKKCNPKVKLISVDSQGKLDLDHLRALLQSSKTPLVSVIYANNETGVLQDLNEIINVVRASGALIHSDFSQALGKVAVKLDEYDLDFVTISGHKFGGPLGCAALLYKKNLHLVPQIIGGGQERGLRSGTENVAGSVGMASAAKDIFTNLEQNIEKATNLRDTLEQNILGFCLDAKVASRNAARLSNTSMIMMPNVQSQMQLVQFDLKGFAVSSGSACSSGKVGESHVLRAMGYSQAEAECFIRVSLSHHNNIEEVESFCAEWKNIFKTYNSKKMAI